MHRGKPALPSDDLPLWLGDLLRITDRKKFKRAVLSEVLPRWDALHPRKRGGPSSLPAFDVYDATATVLEALTQRKWKSLEWKELIAQVQARVKEHQTGDKRRGELYSAATIRRHVRDYIYMILYWNEIPPRLLDRRQRWMPRRGKALDDRVCAFYQFKATLPYAKGALDVDLQRYVKKI